MAASGSLFGNLWTIVTVRLWTKIAVSNTQKYNFNREINDKRIAREIIFLPITDNGTPDYTYMEKYSKNLLREKIQRYIKYVEC